MFGFVACFALYQLLPTSVFWAVFTIGFIALWIHSSYGMSLRRKTAISTWSESTAGSIYAKQGVDMTNGLNFITKYKERTGERLTVTHLVGKAVALTLKSTPSLNGRLLFGRYVPNPTIDVCFLVSTDNGKNLAPKTIRETDKKSLSELAAELNKESAKIRSNEDVEFKKNMDLVKILPTFLLNGIGHLIGFISGELGLGVPAIGLKPRNFGSCIITNVGVFGVEEAYAPFTPFAKVPLLLLVGAIKDTPVARDGQVVIRPMLNLMATLDHRFVDGFDGASVAKKVKDLLENPERLESVNPFPKN